MKKEISNECTTTNKYQLIEWSIDVWDKSEAINCLNMPKQIDAVITAKGVINIIINIRFIVIFYFMIYNYTST